MTQNDKTIITQRQRSTQACVYFFVGVLLFLACCCSIVTSLSFLALFSARFVGRSLDAVLLFPLTCTCTTHYTFCSPFTSSQSLLLVCRSRPFHCLALSRFPSLSILHFSMSWLSLGSLLCMYTLSTPPLQLLPNYASFLLFSTAWPPFIPSCSIRKPVFSHTDTRKNLSYLKPTLVPNVSTHS